jgi:hypothetical protein
MIVRGLLLLLVLAMGMGPMACQRRQNVLEDGNIAAALPSMMGETEERARQLLEEMTDLVEANQQHPDQAVQRMQAFLRVNAPDMRETAVQMQTIWDALSGFEARVYEAQLAAYLGEAMHAWVRAKQAFGAAHPEELALIQESVDRADDAP